MASGCLRRPADLREYFFSKSGNIAASGHLEGWDHLVALGGPLLVYKVSSIGIELQYRVHGSSSDAVFGRCKASYAVILSIRSHRDQLNCPIQLNKPPTHALALIWPVTTTHLTVLICLHTVSGMTSRWRDQLRPLAQTEREMTTSDAATREASCLLYAPS